jgi:SAM-dependent MidA family methyltransferase
VDDLFVRVGRQDLTADVDFRALERHGRRAGFETVLHTTVAELLLGDSGDERLARLKVLAESSLEADRRAAVLRELLDPESVGGAYRVMLQVRE